MPKCAFLFLFCLLLTCCAAAEERVVCFDNVCVEAEVADTDEKRHNGLMFRKSLAKDEGMLFVFEKEGIYSFWMKNTRISLDIIWISRDKRVVEIRTNVPPCGEPCDSLIPKAEAKYVLEVNAGFVKKNGIKPGDEISF